MGELCSPSYVKALLERHGFRFSKSKGQNFLIERWVPERIAAESGVNGDTGVLEIGPGIGCLTAELSERAGKVVAVELDRTLEPLLKETVGERGNVDVIFGDILKLDLAEICRERFDGLEPVVCANLPYNITSPVLTRLLESKRFDAITVMIQREVARRICASAGSSEYGAFTVFVNWHCEPEILFDVPPGCFMPRPKVTSSVIRLKSREAPPAGVKDEGFFFRVVRASFNQRRKTMANALGAALPGASKREIEAVIAGCGFDPMVRGEALDISGFARVADRLYELR